MIATKKIWKLTLICLLQKNLEIGSYMFATKKFGIVYLYVCYKKIWKLNPICLLQKYFEIDSYMFGTKKFES